MAVRRALAWGGLAVAVMAIAYVAGVVPAPAVVMVDHCYVTYDRLERQRSRCVGHWTRAGFDTSGTVHSVPVSTRWQALTVDPDDNYEWEVAVPESSRRHNGLTMLTHAWVVPRLIQVLLTALAATVVGCLVWITASRLRRRRTLLSLRPARTAPDRP
jgi:hypothetical protein